MKTFRLLLLFFCTIVFSGCEDGEPTAYEKLKIETGASDEELEDGIKFFTKFCLLMHDEVGAGTISVEDLIDSAKNVDEVMAEFRREDELAAIVTLGYLSALEKGEIDEAKEMMSWELTKFVEVNYPITEVSPLIRKKIFEYAKTSPSLTAINQIGEELEAEVEKPEER